MVQALRLDSGGIAAMLRSGEVAEAVASAGGRVQANAEGETASGEPIRIETRNETTARGVSLRPVTHVTMAHPAALRVEAKRGTLIKAAASAGLEVTQQ